MSQQQWNSGAQGGQPYGQQQWGAQQPQQQWAGGPSQPRQSNTLWWVLIGIAAAGLIAIVVWVVLAQAGNSEQPEPVPATTSSDTEAPGGEEPGGQEPGGAQGSRDLSDPAFPDSVGGLQKTAEDEFPEGVLVGYEGDGTVVSASVAYDNSAYDDAIAGDLDDHERIGNADCGYDEFVNASDEVLPPIPTCAMNGSGGYLSVAFDPMESTGEMMSLADLAALTEELYAVL